jgi:hypothetical protein
LIELIRALVEVGFSWVEFTLHPASRNIANTTLLPLDPRDVFFYKLEQTHASFFCKKYAVELLLLEKLQPRA